MKNELEILKWLEKNKNITQRDISNRTGISLGNVNITINKLINKGMINVERRNSRTIKYIVTQRGIKKKTEELYKNIISSYKIIEKFNCKMEIFFRMANEDNLKKKFYILFGLRDELLGIIEKNMILNRINYRCIDEFEKLNCFINEKDYKCKEFNDLSILAWHPDCTETLFRNDIKYNNILEI
ncbi:MAG: winged helix-turn-helix transcriptional regulator [Clostridiales bacterium]